MKIALIEDHKIIRDAVSAYFNKQKDYEVTHCSNSVEEFYKEFVKHESPDILLLDIQLPGTKGHEAIPKLRHTLKESKIIIFSNSEDEQTVLDALKLGADGYIHKSASLEEVQKSIEGHRASLSPHIAEHLIHHIQGVNSNKIIEQLSEREKEVLKLLAKGLTQKKIANELFISLDTVRYHCKNIYLKLGVNSNIEAVNIYLNN
ncbi:MAG: response regulator [Flavobacteriaceae bacterium]